jgi:mono/diheme cytochrome c family protein
MDNYSGEVMSTPVDAPALSEHWQTIARSTEVAQRGVTALIEAPDGAVLIAVMGDNDHPTGMIAKLVPKGEAPPPVASVVQAVSVADAQRLFGVNCARCHGVSGKGDGPDAQRLGDFVPDFTGQAFHRWRTDEELLTAIREGGTAVGRGPMMPPWQGVLREAEILALKDYLRTLPAAP